jgi:hypothetical protein
MEATSKAKGVETGWAQAMDATRKIDAAKAVAFLMA